MKLSEQMSFGNDKENLQRVTQLYNVVLDANNVQLSKTPKQRQVIFRNASGQNLMLSLDDFKSLFYKPKSREIVFNYLINFEREFPDLKLKIPNNIFDFNRLYKLEEPKQLGILEGTYVDENTDRKFVFVNKGSKLYLKSSFNRLRELELVKTYEYKLGDEYYFIFESDVDGNIYGGTFEETKDGLTKTYEVTKIKSGQDEEIADDEWKCIEQFNKEKGFIPLSLSVNGSFKFQDISKKIDNRKVQIVFYKDHKLILRFADNSQPIPKMTGTWECGEDEKSYKLIWDNGQIQIRTLEGDKTESGDTKTEDQDVPKKENLFSKACGTNVKACPTKQEVLDNKKAYSLCMKCPEIKELQESPRFSTFYSIRLRTMNLPEKTDEYFGPAMELAVKDFQASNRLGQTGKVGKYTYERITMPYKPVVFDDKKKPVDKKKVETGDEWLRANSKL